MTLKKEDVRGFTEKYSKVCKKNDSVEKDLFTEYGVKRGLRDLNGKGVVTGITNISRIESSEIVDGKTVPCPGKLYYRGYHIQELVKGFMEEGRYGFEEIAYLLVFGELPTQENLREFQEMLSTGRRLPTNLDRKSVV